MLSELVSLWVASGSMLRAPIRVLILNMCIYGGFSTLCIPQFVVKIHLDPPP